MTTAEYKVIGKIAARNECDETAGGQQLKSRKGMVNRRKKTVEELGALIKIATDVKKETLTHLWSQRRCSMYLRTMLIPTAMELTDERQD